MSKFNPGVMVFGLKSKMDGSVERARKSWPQPKGPNAVQFMKRRGGQCRWPLWGEDCHEPKKKFVCGDPADDGESYCAIHKARSALPPKTESRLINETKQVERDLKRGRYW